MMINTVEIIENKQIVSLDIMRVAFYAQAKVAECRTKGNAIYYLYFYKNEFLTAKSATKLKRNGFIETSMEQGMTFDAPHPFITLLFQQKQPLTIISFSKLLKSLEQHKTPQEIALIFSFFNDFIKPEPLQKVIEKQFFEHRRNGQLLHAFQVLQVAKRMNQNEWARVTSNRMEYQKYVIQYSEPFNNLFENDPVFAEVEYVGTHREDPSYTAILKKEKRTLDLLALCLDHFTTSPSLDKYRELTALLQMYLNQTDYMHLLLLLNKQISFPGLRQDLLFLLMEQQEYEVVFDLLTNYSIQLTDEQKDKVKTFLTHADVLTKIHENTTEVLISLFKDELEKLEHILRQCVTSLLKNYSVDYVNQWLYPVRLHHLSLPILSKIENMVAIQNDPDKQSLLGEYYYELQHYEKAIECFSWEMELKSTDPRPVRWLSKLYKELGMERESKDYQQVFLSMQKAN